MGLHELPRVDYRVSREKLDDLSGRFENTRAQLKEHEIITSFRTLSDATKGVGDDLFKAFRLLNLDWKVEQSGLPLPGLLSSVSIWDNEGYPVVNVRYHQKGLYFELSTQEGRIEVPMKEEDDEHSIASPFSELAGEVPSAYYSRVVDTSNRVNETLALEDIASVVGVADLLQPPRRGYMGRDESSLTALWVGAVPLINKYGENSWAITTYADVLADVLGNLSCYIKSGDYSVCPFTVN